MQIKKHLSFVFGFAALTLCVGLSMLALLTTTRMPSADYEVIHFPLFVVAFFGVPVLASLGIATSAWQQPKYPVQHWQLHALLINVGGLAMFLLYLLGLPFVAAFLRGR